MPAENANDSYSYVPQALSSLLPKLGGKPKEVVQVVPKWKTNLISSVSKNSIISRTKHILNSITTAESNASKWRRIEDLLIHCDQFPEARYHAVKEGAIKVLLRSRQLTKDEQILGKQKWNY